MHDVWLEIISGVNTGVLAFFLRPFLYGISCLYRIIIYVRNKCFDFGFLPIYRSPIKSISIGNITLGGTGKTPLTIFIAKTLSNKYRVAILTRGYGGKIRKKDSPARINSKDSLKLDAALYGDEPCLMANSCPRACVYVHPKRSLSARVAEQDNCEVLIMDDGFQHRYLHRNTDIVIIDSSNPFGYGALFPRGKLREPLSSLKRAQIVVIHWCTNAFFSLKDLKQKITEYTAAPIVVLKMDGRCAVDLCNKKVAFFCALGNPGRFVDTICSLGAHIVFGDLLPDHMPFGVESLQKLAMSALDAGAQYLVCTEKDAVKLPSNLELPLPIAIVSLSISFLEGEEFWQSWIDSI